MSRRRRERDMEAEFRFHLEREAEELRRAGMDPDAARRQAALTLGSAEHWQEEARAARRGARCAAWGRDLRLALRGLRRAPGFAAVAILTLALGIGANTAVFSVVEAVLLRPLPFAAPQQLGFLQETDQRHPGSRYPVSYPDFLDYRQAPALAGAAVYRVSDAILAGQGDATHVRMANASAGLFTVLGVAPTAGRGFRPAEDRPGSLAGVDAVILSAALARDRFGDSQTALGRSLTLDGRPYQVVGVMAPGFRFPLDDHEDLWTTMAPLQVSANGPPLTAQRGAAFLRAVVRRAPAAPAAGLAGQLDTIAARLQRQYPADNAHLGVVVEPLRDYYSAPVAPVLWVLLAAAGLVLLIACVNLAGLMLARAVRRRPEFALRAALGAGRAAVLRQLLCESLTVGLLGAAAGLGLAQLALSLLLRLSPEGVARLQQARLSPAALLLAVVLGLLTAVVFGLFPALELARGERGRLQDRLRATRSSPGGPRGWRRGLVGAQFALAVTVLVGALLLLHSLGRLLAIEPGFSPRQVLTASLFLPDARYPQPDDQSAYFSRLIAQLRRQPGVSTAAAAFGVPLTGYNIGVNFDLTDHPLPPAERPSTHVGIVTPGYFAALGIPLLQGRDFTAADRHLSPPVAIVNRSFARTFLAGRGALGARLTPSLSSYPGPDPAYTVVGVVGDTRQSALSAPDPAMLYLPENQLPFGGMTLVVRFAPGAASRATAAVRAATHDLDPDVPAFALQPLSDYLSGSLAAARLSATLLALFASLALLLAALGLYAVMAQAVAQRRREIGLRMALGADRTSVVRLVMREGLTMAAWGTVAGLAAAWALGRSLAGALGAQLYATPLLDPLAFGAAPLLLLATALFACFLPARRAASADPLAALRLE